MATRTIIIRGYNYDAASSATVLFDGVEVFAGTLTASVDTVPDAPASGPASEAIALFKFDFNNADDSQMTTHTLSVTCDAGHIDVGQILSHCNPDAEFQSKFLDIDGKFYYGPGNNWPYGDGSDTADCERTNILKDGAALSLLDADADAGIGEPQGGKDAPVWTGYTVKLEAGEVLTCGVRVPEIINATLP
jgi:hypothetical protein|tara:strand:+ start:530 stop:1102 length:573 start_codon:yes stop_codon:yes gene_type:complete